MTSKVAVSTSYTRKDGLPPVGVTAGSTKLMPMALAGVLLALSDHAISYSSLCECPYIDAEMAGKMEESGGSSDAWILRAGGGLLWKRLMSLSYDWDQ